VPPAYPPVELTVGAHVALLFGDATTRSASDVVTITSATSLVGAHFGPRYRFLPTLSFGARGAVSFAGSSTFWQGELDARVHPFGVHHPDLWIGVDGGLVAVVQQLEESELGPTTTSTSTAPLFGAGLGIDFLLTPFLAVGPELRGVFVPFGTAEALPDRGTSYGTQLGVSLAVTATVLVGI
jgi:hypothetical protein